MLVIALSNGEVIIRAPFEDGKAVLLTVQSGLDKIVDIAAPTTPGDDSFFALLNADGRMKIYNFTIIENFQTYNKYIRDNFGVKGINTNSPNATKRGLEDTPQGQRMIDQNFPLRFSSPL